MINTTLLFVNIAAICFGIILKLSPQLRFKLGYRLQASALADEARQKHYKELLQNFQESEQDKNVPEAA